ncbi:MAG: DUF4212 domain-containing protein [Bacteroidales bacterium]|nr:DUF4212 domain-containing protein [Bacteroidales bacterium]
MEENRNDYHISFFKPTTPRALANRNMVIWLVSIWVVAIFGFQIALRLLEKPTPEAAYKSFESSWPSVKSNTANQEELKDFAGATLSVLGKVFIDAGDKAVLDNAFNRAVYQILDEGQKEALIPEIKNFEALKAEIKVVTEPDYVKAKKELMTKAAPLLGIPENNVLRDILPLELNTAEMNTVRPETMKQLPGIMEKYLVHNQSVLTNFKFLGFPFHYFYTAVLLLILFVFLCWLYCISADRLNKKFDISD